MPDDGRAVSIRNTIGAVAYRTEETEGDISIMDQPIVLPLQALAFAASSSANDPIPQAGV